MLDTKELLRMASLPLRFLAEFHRGFRLNYVRGLQWEEEELENILALVLFGSYIGLPHPPGGAHLPPAPPYAQGDICNAGEEPRKTRDKNRLDRSLG